jgi:hypothetical protein
MRLLWGIISVFVVSVLMTGGALLLVLRSPSDPGWLVGATAAISVLAMGPVVVGSLLASWDVRASAEARRLTRRWVVGILIADLLAAGFIVVYTVVQQSPWWVAAVLIGTGIVLMALAPAIGRALYRMPDAEAPSPTAGPLPPGELRRKILAIALTFTITFVVGVSVLMWVWTADEFDSRGFELVLPALQFAFIASAIAAMLVSLSVNRPLRSILGSDPARAARIRKAVYARERQPLVDDEQESAVQFARFAPAAIGFQLVYLLLLYVGLAIGSVLRIADGEVGWFDILLLVLFVVAICVLTPLFARQLRRARRYEERFGVNTSPSTSPDR